jgi:hypothetical protein
VDSEIIDYPPCSGWLAGREPRGLPSLQIGDKGSPAPRKTLCHTGAAHLIHARHGFGSCHNAKGCRVTQLLPVTILRQPSTAGLFLPQMLHRFLPPGSTSLLPRGQAFDHRHGQIAVVVSSLGGWGPPKPPGMLLIADTGLPCLHA